MCYFKSKSLIKSIKKNRIIVRSISFISIVMTIVSYGRVSYFFRVLAFISLTSLSSLSVSEALANESTKQYNCKKYCEYEVKRGDNLSHIFKKLKIKNAFATVKLLDEADAEFLLIDTIKPGYILRFWIEKEILTKLELEINAAKRIQYTRKKKGYFQAEEMNVKGEWIEYPLIGEIKGSFYLSTVASGSLKHDEYQSVIDIFKDRIDFKRDLHPGDAFKIIFDKHWVGDIESGEFKVRAVTFTLRKKNISAYLHTDGKYYDENGNTLQANAFRSTPLETERPTRISSHFNPYRTHPVTGRISPHNGTDFAVDVGTPIVATADGVVTIVRNHPYAGKYLVIDHGTQYKTRYLHNSQILVKKGQTVTKGQRIALSGRSGRVSGAHLHYEILFNGKPIDAMRSELIPMILSVPKKEMKKFRQMVLNYQSDLKAGQS